MNYKIILLIGTLVILQGCTTTMPSVPSTYTLSPNSENGLVVSAVKYRGLLSGYHVYFRGKGNDKISSFEAGAGSMLIPIPPKSDFQYAKGKLTVAELPAGEYEIFGWSVQSGYANLEQTQPFSIQFRIEAGKATYIGAFVFNVTNTMGLTVTGVRVDFTDMFGEDIQVLKNLYQNLVDTEIYMGLESGLVKNDIGGQSSLYWNMPPIFVRALK